MRARSHTPGQFIRGFTLIELMVVVVVAGILASIAIPAYQSYMMKSRRSDARTTLSAMVQAQERYRSNNAAYSDNPASLLGGSASSFNGHYVMTVVDSNGDGYVSGYEVHAKPNPGDPQEHDTDCRDIFIRVKSGILSYRDSNMAATATSSPCWPQ